MTQYICTTKCWHKGSLYRPGQMVTFGPDGFPKDKEGNLLHFIPVEQAKPVQIEEVETPKKRRGGVMVNGKDTE